MSPSPAPAPAPFLLIRHATKKATVIFFPPGEQTQGSRKQSSGTEPGEKAVRGNSD